MAKRQKSTSEWVGRILHIRQRLALNQSEFAARINYSAMAVSRWESGAYEPTAEAYVQMGNLAEGTESTWFWTRAGLKSSDLSRILPEAKGGRDKGQFPDFEIVVAGSGARRAVAKIKAELVAIPVLNAHAGSHGIKGDNILDFDQADVADVVAAPALWCPNPTATNCLRVRGSSMSPLILDGDIVVVDSSQHNVKDLNGKIVVAWHRKTGLSLSRFLMMKGVQLLESENRDYKPVSMQRDRSWRIIGKVLWWIRKSP
jgi:SOS-response transcriptional repressor LexA